MLFYLEGVLSLLLPNLCWFIGHHDTLDYNLHFFVVSKRMHVPGVFFSHSLSRYGFGDPFFDFAYHLVADYYGVGELLDHNMHFSFYVFKEYAYGWCVFSHSACLANRISMAKFRFQLI